MTRCSISTSPSTSRAASMRCARPRAGCATVDASSISRPASSAPSSRPTAPTATKAAIEVLTGILSKELRGRSITVNAVAPGPTATDLFLHGKSPELIDRLAKANPLERLGKPEDIASVVSFLAGPDGSWINGQTLRANGGLV
ncbi:SDR family oxidoreductase [Bradyrhizobium sp. Ai1a-2]|uniref:SDR family oxidoreductase n=1 Tax=Bradyrhizobium sp. Ai1a-2 TaxID=196490 RepID=UPI0031B85176